jgi:hypothetical protein
MHTATRSAPRRRHHLKVDAVLQGQRVGRAVRDERTQQGHMVDDRGRVAERHYRSPDGIASNAPSPEAQNYRALCSFPPDIVAKIERQIRLGPCLQTTFEPSTAVPKLKA